MINSIHGANSNTVEGIILAAGFSSRANAFKPALLLAGKPLLQHTIESMIDFCQRIIVVAGYRLQEVIELTAPYRKVEVVYNENYQKGMFSSVKTGVGQLGGDRFLLMPGDIPMVTAETYRQLLEQRGDIVIPTYRGRKGHPVLMATAMKEEILGEGEDSNLGMFIRRRGFITVAVDDDGILVDIDTAADYGSLAKRYNRLAAVGTREPGSGKR